MLKPIGDWKTVLLLVNNLEDEFKAARKIALAKIGLFMEGKAKKHMRDQDLNWIGLKPATISAKIRRGESTNILIATSTYFQSITHKVEVNKVTAGVDRKKKNEEGVPIHNIAAGHEFGFGDLPKRKLWEPVGKEGVAFAKTGIFEKELAKRLAKYNVL